MNGNINKALEKALEIQKKAAAQYSEMMKIAESIPEIMPKEIRDEADFDKIFSDAKKGIIDNELIEKLKKRANDLK